MCFIYFRKPIKVIQYAYAGRYLINRYKQNHYKQQVSLRTKISIKNTTSQKYDIIFKKEKENKNLQKSGGVNIQLH